MNCLADEPQQPSAARVRNTSTISSTRWRSTSFGTAVDTRGTADSRCLGAGAPRTDCGQKRDCRQPAAAAYFLPTHAAAKCIEPLVYAHALPITSAVTNLPPWPAEESLPTPERKHRPRDHLAQSPATKHLARRHGVCRCCCGSVSSATRRVTDEHSSCRRALLRHFP